MTQNQIAYWNMVYANRHNERADAETARSNQAKEYETARSNAANEALKAADVFGNLELNQNKLYENRRHNVAMEQTELAKLQESVRHNIAGEQISSSGALRQWIEMGLNPLWYTNGAPAVATGSMGALTLPTQQEVMVSTVQGLTKGVTQFTDTATGKAKAAVDAIKRQARKSVNKVSSATKSLISGVADSTAKGINQYQRQRSFR